VGLVEVVHEPPDLVERELGGRVRVEHRGVVGRIPAATERCLDGQALDVDVGLHEGGHMARELAHGERLDAARGRPHGTSTQRSPAGRR
jgi:hypothetical protein